MSFAGGLASGLRGLPQALAYNRDRREKKEYQESLKAALGEDGIPDYKKLTGIASASGNTRDALFFNQMGAASEQKLRDQEYRDALGAATRPDGSIDYEMASNIAAAGGRPGQAQQYFQMGAARDDRAGAKGDRNRSEFVGRLLNSQRNGTDIAAANRLAERYPEVAADIFAQMAPGGDSSRSFKGFESIQDPSGRELWSPVIENAMTESTGPMTQRASADRDDPVMNFDPSQLAQRLSPWMQQQEGAEFASLGGGRGTYNVGTGVHQLTPSQMEKGRYIITDTGQRFDTATNQLYDVEDNLAQQLQAAESVLPNTFQLEEFGDNKRLQLAQDNSLVLAEALYSDYGIPVLESLPELHSIMKGDNEFSEAILDGTLEERTKAIRKLIKTTLPRRFGVDMRKPKLPQLQGPPGPEALKGPAAPAAPAGAGLGIVAPPRARGGFGLDRSPLPL